LVLTSYKVNGLCSACIDSVHVTIVSSSILPKTHDSDTQERSTGNSKLVAPEPLYQHAISNLHDLTSSELFTKYADANEVTISVSKIPAVLKTLGLDSVTNIKTLLLKVENDNDDKLTHEQFTQLLSMCRDIQNVQTKMSLGSDRGASFKKRRWEVFLGGSCNPTTWRKDLVIPTLESAGISYFNPQVDEWSPDLIVVESRAKKWASILFYVIDGATRAMSSMIEVVELICSKRLIVLTVIDIQDGTVINGQAVTGRELKDLNRTRAYLSDVANRHGVPVFKTVLAATHFCVKMFESLRFGITAESAHSLPSFQDDQE